MKVLGRLIPANYRAIAATQVARTPSTEGRVVVLSGELQQSYPAVEIGS